MNERQKKHITKKQNSYVNQVHKRLSQGNTALLQLPTGFGKTRVICQVLNKMIERQTGEIWVCLPRQEKQLKREKLRSFLEEINNKNGDIIIENDVISWRKEIAIGIKQKDGFYKKLADHIEFISHRDLVKRLITPSKKKIKGLKHPPRFLIIDEVHRISNGLNEILCHENLKKTKVILMSATPVNPVGLHSGDGPQKFTSEADDDVQMEKSLRKGYSRLYGPLVKRVSGKVINFNSGNWDDFLVNVKNAEEKIKPVPGAVHLIKHYRDKLKKKGRYTRKDSDISWDVSGKDSKISKAVTDLITFQEQNYSKKCSDEVVPVVERIAISGYQHSGIIQKNQKQRSPRCKSAKNCKKIRKKIEEDDFLNFKYKILNDFIKSHPDKKILVFCSYIDTVRWLYYKLNENLSKLIRKKECDNCEKEGKVECVLFNKPSVVWSTEDCSVDEERLLYEFNNRRASDYGCGRVLVTSDRCSESIGLHNNCNVVIHFDLCWSPLRIMQRVGRLWRIGALGCKTSDHLTTYPKVYHLKYPCSVDEEIYFRLKRRWKHLEDLGLGLDFIPFHLGIGKDLYSHLKSIKE